MANCKFVKTPCPESNPKSMEVKPEPPIFVAQSPMPRPIAPEPKSVEARPGTLLFVFRNLMPEPRSIETMPGSLEASPKTPIPIP